MPAANWGQPVQWDLDSLLQELMLALVGYTGDIFVENSNADPSCTEIQHPDRSTISLAPEVVLADDVNREELMRLVQMGFHFKQIKQFIQQEQQPANGAEPSKYRCALCNGLDEVLCLYEDEVVLLQDKLLQQGLDKGLPGIAYELADMQRLLVHVHYMVHELRRRNPVNLAPEEPDSSGTAAPAGLVARAQHCGARLLQWLHDRKSHGEPMLRLCTQRLMWHVYQVFFNQLTTWMVHGLLLDGGKEFLIRFISDADPAAVAEGATAAVPAADTDTVRDGGSGKAAAAGMECTDVTVMTEADTYKDFHSAFVVDNLQLPPGLSTHTASSIEFVGRAVRLLKSAPASAKLQEMQDSWGSYNQQQLAQDQLAAGLGPGAGTGMPQQLLPYGDAVAYAAALRLLQDQPEYSPGALERTVEAIRADVASRLWQLVVLDSRLVDHLAALKDYMLLAKGDFYQSFLSDAAKLLMLPEDKVATKDLAVPWQSAAAKSTAADDPHFKFFTLAKASAAHREQQQLQQAKEAAALKAAALTAAGSKLSMSGDIGVISGPDVSNRKPELSDCLRLNANLPWPLGVLITPRHLDEYNNLFALLLKVKRVQLDLEAAWQELGRLCGRKGAGTQPRDIGELLQLRQSMGHLISNLQVYLQLDVIESNYDLLLERVAAAQDFREVQDAHEKFVTTLKQQSLLYSARLMTHIHQLLAAARRLCALVKGARGGGIDMDAVQEVTKEFKPVVQNFFTAMRSKFLRQAGQAPYINQLYERLNYNDFLTRHLKTIAGMR